VTDQPDDPPANQVTEVPTEPSAEQATELPPEQVNTESGESEPLGLVVLAVLVVIAGVGTVIFLLTRRGGRE
jgi:uncharacterized protein HemX